MPSQRDIREKALHYLFAYTTVLPEEFCETSFWDIALEPEDKATAKTALKALLHQLQALPKLSSQFGETVHLVVPQLKTYGHKKEAQDLLLRAKQCSELLLELQKLKAYPPIHLEGFASFFEQTKTTLTGLKALQSTLTGIVGKIEQGSQITELIAQLLETLTRTDYVASPLDHPDQTTTAALHKRHHERAQLTEKSATLARGVAAAIGTQDEVIDRLLTNYSKDQIGKVERLILHLAMYEVTTLELPKAVAITEALGLTRKFTTENAVALVNAVLDQL